MRHVASALGRRGWFLALVAVAAVAVTAGPAQAQTPQPEDTQLVPGCSITVGEQEFGPVVWALISAWSGASEWAKDTATNPDATYTTVRESFPEWFEPADGPYIPNNSPQWLKDELALEEPACYLARRRVVNACYLHGTEENHGDRLNDPGSGTDFDPPPENSIYPTTCFGEFPAGVYDLGFDDANLTDFGTRILGTITLAMFGLANGIAHGAIWLVGWGFNFDLLKSLLGDETSINSMVGKVDDNMVGTFGLRDLAWLVLIAWAGYMALKGRLTMVGGELAVSFVLVVLGALLLADPQRYLVAAVTATDQMSAAALTAWRDEGNSETDIDAVIFEVQSQMQEIFVQEPYMVLNWGETLNRDRPETADCYQRALRILSVGPHGAEAWPREYMRRSPDADCARLATFNARADTARMVGALLTLVGSLLLLVFMGLLALTVLIAKVALFGLFLLAPFAVVVAILPGGGRRLVWVWLASVGQTILIVVISGGLLSTVLIVQINLSKAVGTVGQVGLVGRFATFDLITFTGIMARRRALGGIQSFTNQLSERLTRATPGGAVTSSPLSPQSAGTNFSLVDRAVGRGAVGAVVPTALFLNQRLGERRNANRSLTNLWRVQAYQEQRDYGRVLMARGVSDRVLRPVPHMRWRRVDVPAVRRTWH
jgi:hypothetical protein